MSNLTLKRSDFDNAPPLEQYTDRTIFQTKEWLKFISQTQKAEPVVAIVEDGNRQVGRFTGLIIIKYGLRILGSPFPGWTTSYMGFNLEPSVSRVDALIALKDFAFRKLKCIHVEIMDRNINISQLMKAEYLCKTKLNTGFEIDLTRDEDTIFASMESSCRRCIRKSVKLGINIEIAIDASFADDYYDQLKDVFAKQGLVPTYSIERVRSLIDCLLPSGQLLLVRAKDDEGSCIASAIFPALNDTMYFWGGASWRKYQSLRPNESIQWFAMRYWKAKGIKKYDMGGGGNYKRKYGGYEIVVPWGRKSKYSVLELLRTLGKDLFAVKQHIRGLGKRCNITFFLTKY